MTGAEPSNAAGSSEARVQTEVRLAAARAGCILWRNNTGAFKDPNTGRWVRYGLSNDSAALNKAIKSSDLIGIDSHGRFLAIECKAEGWRGVSSDREHAQARYLAIVNERRGVGFFASNVRDFSLRYGG